MVLMNRPAVTRSVLLVALVLFGGCSGGETPEAGTPQTAPVDSSTENRSTSESRSDTPAATLPTISLGGPDPTAAPASSSDFAEVQRRQAVIHAMQPLQVMLGSWKGTTQREFGDFKALDEPEWVWDFQTDPQQPAMVMTSHASPYFREMRLTYLTADDHFRLQITDPEGQVRSFSGTFIQPVEEFAGDDKRLHRRYKLELTEFDPAVEKDVWQIVLNQQENNRYLVELAKQRGSRFMRFDTVANQRQGTSFALSDADYGEKACIITGGLGTSTVSYKGKTYWVCCSGCRSAFEEDPEKWIAASLNSQGE